MCKTWEELDKIDEFRKSKIHLRCLGVERKEKEKTDPYVYQYRNLESFWSIVESDSFWATNARFSNDHAEQSLGMEKVKDVFAIDGELSELFEDCYIVCFCDDNDKLSQWRGYAPEGVSIGFDFNNVRSFYIKSLYEEKFLHLYNSCYKVEYIDKGTGRDEIVERFDLNTIDDKNVLDNFKRQAKEIIPYIKHKGFHEEAESRLVFSNANGDLADYIHYRDIGKLKVPYIVVKAGDIEENKNKLCVVRINADGDDAIQLTKDLKDYFAKRKIRNVKFVCCTETQAKETDDTLCYGCSLREAYIPGVNGIKPKCRYARNRSEGFHISINNEIYISDSQEQEKIYNEIDAFLLEQEGHRKMKIWCEGHLPIRSITVGNLHNKEVVKESIEHYCKQHYWLRSVKVSCSDNPYRSSLL